MAAPNNNTQSGQAQSEEKQPTLRIGNKGEGKHIRIPFDPPTTVDEFYQQFTGGVENEEFLMDLALRGLRIKIQDMTRDKVAEDLKAGKPKEQIVNEVLEFLGEIDITEKKERKAPTPRKPVDLAGINLGTEDAKQDLLARLAAAGVKVQGL
jgi:hypothetical protein